MDKVYEYLINEISIKYGDTVVVACSGGPDSMALLDMLIKIKKAYDVEIVCAHVNHNTGRIGQKEEQKFVEDYCKLNNVIFETMTISDYGDDNFHNEARSKRYNYFAKLVQKYNAKYLFTAHHGDDLIETILMRIVRGSTLRGYSGFSKELDMNNYKIIRPLINVSKKEIIDYNKSNKVPYNVDSSNLKDVYTRNRFRKYIVSAIKKEEPKAHLKFYKFSKTLLEYNNYIDKQVKGILNKVCPQNIINIEEFKKLDDIIGMKVIYHILEATYQDDLMLITDHHAELIEDLIKSKKANSYIYLPNNIKALKTYNNIEFIKEELKNNEYEYEFNSYINLPNKKSLELVNSVRKNDNFVCRLNSKEVVLPLRIRTKRQGDKMQVKGMFGTKKVKDIYIDSKISTKDRELWPIVIDSNNVIVWIPGLKKSKFDKPITEKCDIIIKYY